MQNAVRLPAEWESQSALMLTWPHAIDYWGPHLTGVDAVFAAIAKATVQHQAVIIACNDPEHRQHVQSLLADVKESAYPIHYYIAPSESSWTRDHGPITVYVNQNPILRKFIFNGWGNKYKHNLDNEVADRLQEQNAFAYPISQQDWILEGGSIETDGEHTLLTTESCLLNPNRNPHLSREQIEEKLREDLGIDRVLWIKHSELKGDDTDGHIDMLARFCDPQTICYTTAHPDNFADKKSLQAMEAELRGFRTREGKPYKLVPLPPIRPIFNAEGEQLPGSYANFLIINDAILLPVYNDPSDALAAQCLQECFPHHKIISIPALPLINQYGSIHCSTMNIYGKP